MRIGTRRSPYNGQARETSDAGLRLLANALSQVSGSDLYFSRQQDPPHEKRHLGGGLTYPLSNCTAQHS